MIGKLYKDVCLRTRGENVELRDMEYGIFDIVIGNADSVY